MPSSLTVPLKSTQEIRTSQECWSLSSNSFHHVVNKGLEEWGSECVIKRKTEQTVWLYFLPLNAFKFSCVDSFHIAHLYNVLFGVQPPEYQNEFVGLEHLERQMGKFNLFSPRCHVESWPWDFIGWRRVNTINLIRPAALLQYEVYIRMTWGLRD